jgi:hypothetical protein
MQRIGRPRIGRWSTDRLIRLALSHGSAQRLRDIVGHLHRRGSQVTMARIVRLVRSPNAHRRALGLDIAAQLRAGGDGVEAGKPFDEATTQAMLVAGLADANAGVVQSAVFGLGHSSHATALPALLSHARHPAALVRFALAFTLAKYPAVEATAALVELAADLDDDVRDWATFSLGTLHDADDEHVRARLWANAHDPDRDVRGEAVVGLARRGDLRVIDLLKARLLDEDCRVYELEAAEEMPRGELLETLRQVRADAEQRRDIGSLWYSHLLDAIDACELVADTAGRDA